MNSKAETAAVLSLIIPGIGNYYLGIGRGTGLAYMIGSALLLYMSFSVNLIYLLYLLLVLTAVHDAYTTGRDLSLRKDKLPATSTP